MARHPAMDLIPEDDNCRRFLIARGKAIQTYSEYEQSLAELYAFLTGQNRDIAGISFFRFNQGRIRADILEKLIVKKCGDTYKTTYKQFWDSLASNLLDVDQTRNQIVHWGTVVFCKTDRPEATLKLTPPNFWDWVETMRETVITENDLYNFISKCSFFGGVVNIFRTVISGVPAELASTWRDICLQAITYPPPDTHPLASQRRKS